MSLQSALGNYIGTQGSPVNYTRLQGTPVQPQPNGLFNALRGVSMPGLPMVNARTLPPQYQPGGALGASLGTPVGTPVMAAPNSLAGSFPQPQGMPRPWNPGKLSDALSMFRWGR